MYIEIILAIIFVLFALLPLIGLPGPILIAIGVLIYAATTGFTAISVGQVIAFVVVGIIAAFIDNLFVLLGAKKYGASKYGIVGAILGLFSVFILGPVGIIIGPPILALFFELTFNRKSFEDSAKASFGAVLGFFVGVLIKTLVGLGMVLWFVAI